MAKHYLTKLMAEKPLLPALVLALVVVGVISLVRAGGYLQLAELTVNDLLLTAAVIQKDETSPVVLVGVTEKEIQSIGTWPLTDTMLAGAIEHLLSMGPRVIGVDIYRDQPVPPGGGATAGTAGSF